MSHKYKISTEVWSVARQVGYEKAIELFGKAGFDCWDLSMFNLIDFDWKTYSLSKGKSPLNNDNYKKVIKSYCDIAKKYGMTCNQAHAPFPSDAKGIFPYIVRSIECAALAGAKCIVIHPMNNASAEENAKMYETYLPYAKKFNIKIACENMWNWDGKEDHATTAACSHHDDFLKHIELVNDEYLGACVDVGHASMNGLHTSPAEMIRKLDKHVYALHLHDVDLKFDNHQIPFSLKVNYQAIVEALHDIDYKGDLTLEADSYPATNNGRSLEEKVLDMKNVADKIRDMLESLD